MQPCLCCYYYLLLVFFIKVLMNVDQIYPGTSYITQDWIWICKGGNFSSPHWLVYFATLQNNLILAHNTNGWEKNYLLLQDEFFTILSISCRTKRNSLWVLPNLSEWITGERKRKLSSETKHRLISLGVRTNVFIHVEVCCLSQNYVVLEHKPGI